MPRHLPFRLRLARTRAPRAPVFAVLAIALATPGLAIASHKSPKKPASVPRCTHFSRVKMARLIDVSSLKFEGKTHGSNICTYTGPAVPGHFSDLLQVDVTAESKALFVKFEQVAKKSAAQQHAMFGTLPSRRTVTFYVIHTYLAASQGPCSPGQTTPELGPPGCSGQPNWTIVSLDSYGALKPRGPKAWVSVNLATESAGPRRAASSLDHAILTGQIR
jgi:hypothetical protein